MEKQKYLIYAVMPDKFVIYNKTSYIYLANKLYNSRREAIQILKKHFPKIRKIPNRKNEFEI